MESIKGVWINAKLQEVVEIEFPVRYTGDSDSIQGNVFQMLECENMIVGRTLKHDDVLMIDADWMSNKPNFGFMYKGIIFQGNGVVLGTGINGVPCDIIVNAYDIEENVIFIIPEYEK